MARSSSILFCSATFLVVVSATAAELPSHKATQPAPAKTCEIDGKPGYKLPGSDICLKLHGYISGQVSAGTLAK